MSLAALIRRMADAGASAEVIALAVEAIEQANSAVDQRRAAARDRKRKERAMKADSHATVTRQSQDNSGHPPPSSLPLSPTPPNSNSPTPSPPYSPPAPRKPTKAELDAIWAETPSIARQRSGRADLERSLTAAMRRGADPADVLVGIRAAYASTTYGGDMAKGVHRLIEGDRWRGFVEDDRPPDWEALVGLWRATGRWASSLGPPPDHPETQVPQQMRAA